MLLDCCCASSLYLQANASPRADFAGGVALKALSRTRSPAVPVFTRVFAAFALAQAALLRITKATSHSAGRIWLKRRQRSKEEGTVRRHKSVTVSRSAPGSWLPGTIALSKSKLRDTV